MANGNMENHNNKVNLIVPFFKKKKGVKLNIYNDLVCLRTVRKTKLNSKIVDVAPINHHLLPQT